MRGSSIFLKRTRSYGIQKEIATKRDKRLHSPCDFCAFSWLSLSSSPAIHRLQLRKFDREEFGRMEASPYDAVPAQSSVFCNPGGSSAPLRRGFCSPEVSASRPETRHSPHRSRSSLRCE